MSEEKSAKVRAFCPNLGLLYESLPIIASALPDSRDERGFRFNSPVIWAQLFC
jgi:hypothetical protein